MAMLIGVLRALAASTGCCRASLNHQAQLRPKPKVTDRNIEHREDARVVTGRS